MQGSTNNTKRRRTSSHSDDNILSLSTLPGDHLTNVSSYLAPTSKLLLACALSAPSTSFSTINWKGDESLTNESKDILTSIGSTVQVLDFGDVGDLAGKLYDDDIAAVLACIDAKNKLKKLQLTHCKRLVGHGLESLRESVVLEHISLPLPLENLSTSVITPIVDSIVGSDGNSLCEINVTNIKHAPEISEFLAKFHKLMTNGDRCECCLKLLEGGGMHEGFEVQSASLTCFDCFKSSCDHCNDDDEYNQENRILECSHCDLTFCEECRSNEDPCYGCGKSFCSVCAEVDIVGAAMTCAKHHCYRPFCTDCVDDVHCDGCRAVHFPAIKARLEKENDEVKGENTQLQNVISDLTEENDELRREIEELRKNMSSGLGILS